MFFFGNTFGKDKMSKTEDFKVSFSAGTPSDLVPVFQKNHKSHCVMEHGDEYQISLQSNLPEHRVSAKVTIDTITVLPIFTCICVSFRTKF